MSPIMRLALPMLAAAGTAFAACTASGTLTIQNSGDASAIASCKTFSGNIAIKTDAAGPIAIDGVKFIDGSLSVENNDNLVEISASDVEEISGSLLLNGVPPLTTVRFPKLKTVGTLKLVALANLANLEFTEKLTKASFVYIDNTNLASLDSIDLETVEKFQILNNRYISVADLKLKNVTDQLEFAGNSVDLDVSLSDLVSANNLTFRACHSVKIPALESLKQGMSVFENTFEEFSAPNLTEIGGALAFVDNAEMTKLSFPQLTKVAFNFQIANNTALKNVSGFPQLKTIGGSLDMNGNFSNVDLPAIADIKGAFNLQATGTEVQKSCDDIFTPLKNKDKIQGKFVCKGGVSKPSGAGTTPTESASTPDKTGAASAVNIQGSALMAGLAAAFFL